MDSTEEDLIDKKVGYGQCRSCLKQDVHKIENVWEMLGCLNIEMSTDPRVSQLLCSDCCVFLQQVRKFRDMAVASQRSLLNALSNSKDSNIEENMLSTVSQSSDNNVDVHTILTTVKVEFDPDTCEAGQAEETTESDMSTPSQFMSNIDVLKKYLTSDPTIGLQGAVKEEHAEETEGAFNEIPITTDVKDEKVTSPDPDDVKMHDDDDLSDEAEVENNIKENNRKRTPRELKYIERRMEIQLNRQVRENMARILHNSTIVPFIRAKGDDNECIYCNKSFKHFKELRKHVEANHNENVESKIQALKVFALKHDMETILNADVSSIKCKVCDQKFTTIDNLVEHLVKVHEQKFHNLSRDPPHNILCFNMSSDRLKCIDCAKSFTHFRGLLMHMNQHYGPYLCPECGSKFLHERSYKLHLAQKNKNELNRPECSLCGATFTRKSHVVRHMQRKHRKDKK